MKKKNLTASELLPQKIGILDWGIGGLGVYKEIRKKIPRAACVYLSDSGFTPYGKVPAKKLVKRLNQIVDFFRQQNILTVVIACNAASTVLNEVKKANAEIQFFGMLEAGKDLILAQSKKSILILGGERTIQSGYFEKAFKKSKYQTDSRAAQPLSGLIETGQHRSNQFLSALDTVTMGAQPEAVLLACTHYPAATAVFKKKFKGATILDPAASVAEGLLKAVPKVRKGPTQFYTTGSVALSKASAYKAFGLKISSFKKVKL